MDAISIRSDAAKVTTLLVAFVASSGFPIEEELMRLSTAKDPHLVKSLNHDLLTISTSPDRFTYETISGKKARAPFVPKTEMATALWEARKRIIAAGEPLEDPRTLLDKFFRARQSW